ncbi:MarR family winged helix-turn-helix transcriptional regulator [Streptantibioticus ferralitis]|uniref:MarR family transcriptional regulator n=1 Tax=Streptantibioticus ferralitis TaxID=236510 RepID=A0ABT5Z4X4_9ACTN|nr:MarR family transcriptional regulator [Streptantibioticus ferralitis]MDF2258882.1 MarR family transcriptional regulator [Streptantibioticus ferralitis]
MAQSANADDLGAVLYDGIRLMARRLRHASTPGELSLPERSALSRLNRGGPATAAELARAEQITPQAMGTTLSGLEGRGLVRRNPDPHDRRRVLVSLTETGLGMLRRKHDARARQVATALEQHFTKAELETLMSAAPLIERLAESI